MRKVAWTAVVLALALAGPGAAQEELRPEDLSGLAGLVHLPRDGFEGRLREILPGYRRTGVPRGTEGIAGDPFLWVFEGAFGAGGQALPAGLVHCARYGLATREALLGRAVSDPEVFPVVSALRGEAEDIARWPEEAVAVLRCSFAWDDARRLRPWAAAEAADLVGPLFAEVTRRDDASLGIGGTGRGDPIYGVEGFQITGRDGPRSSFSWLESLRVTRQILYQRVVIRIYLLGGGA